MRSRKPKYREGDWFAVPLGDGDYAPGLAARVAPKTKGVLGYLFARRFAQVPTLSEIQNFTPNESARVRLFGDLGLYGGEWPLVGRLPNWDRTLWPIPPLALIRPHAQSYIRVERGPDNPDVVLRQQRGDFETSPLNRAGAWDGESVQSILARLLLGTSNAPIKAPGAPAPTNGQETPTVGSVFAMPIGDGTFCLGLIGAVSAEQKTVVAFFSARIVSSVPPPGRFAGLTRASTIRVFSCDDSRLRNGDWPVVGPLVGWDPLIWRVPPFVRRDEIARWVHQIDAHPDKFDADNTDAPPRYPMTRVEDDGAVNSRAIELELTGLLKSDRIISSYKEGVWVAVPLPGEPGCYAPGLIARVAADHKAFLGYFFAEAIKGLPTLDRLCDYRPDMAAEIFWFDDVALVLEPWPTIGSVPNWHRENWPVPPQHAWKLEADSAELLSEVQSSGDLVPDYDDEQLGFERDGVKTRRAFTKREVVSADYVGYGLRLVIGDRTRRQKLTTRNMSRRKAVRH